MDEQSALFLRIQYLNMNSNSNNNGRRRRGAGVQARPAARPGLLPVVRARPRRRPPPLQGAVAARRPAVLSAPAGFSSPAQQQSVAAAYSTGQYQRSPQFSRNSADSCRIVHREFITNVTGSVAFTVASSLAVNPGIAATFPWLSTQAQGWERYRFNKLKFCYYTRTGSNVPGSVLLSPDYDAADTVPISEAVASTYADASEDAPWKDIECELKPKNMNMTRNEHFVRTEALGANQDIKTYDVANLFVSTVDGTAVSWGKLWVEYDVSLFTPQFGSQGAAPFGGSVTGAGGGLTAAKPFGAAPTVLGRGFSVSSSGTNNVITFSRGGDFIVEAQITGTVITAASTVYTGSGTSSNFGAGFIVNAAGTIAIASSHVVGAAAGDTLTLTMTATTVTASIMDIGSGPSGTLV